MAVEVILPRQGQSVETCQIVSWTRREGEQVAAGETICEVETDKAVFDVEAPAVGTILKIFFAEGEDVPVLSRLAVVGEPGEDISTLEPASERAEEPPERAPGKAGGQVRTPAERPNRSSGRAASPRARRLAEDNRLDLEEIPGSGPGGRIIERDVAAVLSGRQPGKPASRKEKEHSPAGAETGFPGPYEDVAVRGVRKIIAERMLASIRSTAQYTLYKTAGAERLLEARARCKKNAAGITLNDMLLYVVSRVLPRFPFLNSHYLDLEDKIRRYASVHLGFAVDTPRGLMVPVIRNADTCSLPELSRRARELAVSCQEGSIGADQLSGGTFTISNLGSLGVERFSPILNPPEVGVLGAGAVGFRHVQVKNGILLERSLCLSLTVNHQAVDGAPAARFLSALGEAIGDFTLSSPLP